MTLFLPNFEKEFNADLLSVKSFYLHKNWLFYGFSKKIYHRISWKFYTFKNSRFWGKKITEKTLFGKKIAKKIIFWTNPFRVGTKMVFLLKKKCFGLNKPENRQTIEKNLFFGQKWDLLPKNEVGNFIFKNLITFMRILYAALFFH